jgi:hypothetical protein
MDDRAYRYAEEMMLAHKRSKAMEESLDAKLIQLNNAVSLTASHCFNPDYCPAVTTQKRGIIGKAIILTKRLARKATYFIVKDMSQEIAAFQAEAINTLSGIISLQEDILLELYELKQTMASKDAAQAAGLSDRTEGNRT